MLGIELGVVARRLFVLISSALQLLIWLVTLRRWLTLSSLVQYHSSPVASCSRAKRKNDEMSILAMSDVSLLVAYVFALCRGCALSSLIRYHTTRRWVWSPSSHLMPVCSCLTLMPNHANQSANASRSQQTANQSANASRSQRTTAREPIRANLLGRASRASLSDARR